LQHKSNGQVNGQSNGSATVGVRYATEKRVVWIQGLARKAGVPIPELLKQAGVASFNEMSLQQASKLIESLKNGSMN